MNPVLEEIINHATTKTIDGKNKRVIGQISNKEGELIQSCIKDINAEVSVEIGLAFGTSALYICEALTKTPNTKHIVIDPYQMNEESYGGIGLNNLKRAGYENIVEFLEKPSHQALAELEVRYTKVDFAFIDGWHTFDHALVDFFFIDKILRIGGIVILDDSDWPAIRKICSFISNNRAYKFVGATPPRSLLKVIGKKNKAHNKLIKKVKKIIYKSDTIQQNLFGATAFQKISNDYRLWDHFVDFN